MTLLDLINHLKETFEKEGNLEVSITRSTDQESEYEAKLECSDITADPYKKTIIFQ